MPTETKLPRLLCQRCGHEWTPRIDPTDVVRCPACSNPRWNQPKDARATV